MMQPNVSISLLLVLIASIPTSHGKRPHLRVSRKEFEVEVGNGTSPCRLSFSRDYAADEDADDIDFDIGKKVLKCGDKTVELPFVGVGTTVPPVDPESIAPATSAPIGDLDSAAPATSAPIVNTPESASPVTISPASSTSGPYTAAPIFTGRVTINPYSTSPQTQAPITSAPITLSPTTSAPVTSYPIATPAPMTSAPTRSAAPVTKAPITISPVSQAPETAAPMMCPGYSDRERDTKLIEKALTLSQMSLLGARHVPQFAALRWIVYEDEKLLCPDDPSFKQRYILATLYMATNGDQWTTCSRNETLDTKPCSGLPFLSPKSECLWGGCQCDGSGNITMISIDNNNLAGELPPEIGFLSHLNELDLDRNGLNGTIPSELGELSALQYLDLDENQLTSTIPEEIYNLQNLQSLDLDTNMLTGTISTRIGELQHLFIAQFDKNQMTGSIPSEVGSLSQLSYFTAVENDFSGSIPEDLCSSTALILANCNLCTVEDCCQGCSSSP